MPIQSVGTKKISLTKKNQHRFDEKSSNTIETNNTRDNNKKRSYPTEKEVDDDDNNSENDADDTLDKFEDEQRGTAKNRRQPKGMYNMITSGGAARVPDYPSIRPEPDYFWATRTRFFQAG